MTLADFTDALIARVNRLATQVQRLLRERNGLDLSVEHASDLAVALASRPVAMGVLLSGDCDDDLVMSHIARLMRVDPKAFRVVDEKAFIDMMTSKRVKRADAVAMAERFNPDQLRRTWYAA